MGETQGVCHASGLRGVNAPPIAYEVDGVRYVAVAAGGNAIFGFKQGWRARRFRGAETLVNGRLPAGGPLRSYCDGLGGASTPGGRLLIT